MWVSYDKGENDNVTGKPVTEKAVKSAHKYAEKGIMSFKAAEEAKDVRNNLNEMEGVRISGQ